MNDGIEAWSTDHGEYQTIHTPVPPVFVVENDRLVIKLIHGNLTLVADVGDGRWFFSQIVAKLIDPALLAQHKAMTVDFKS